MTDDKVWTTVWPAPLQQLWAINLADVLQLTIARDRRRRPAQEERGDNADPPCDMRNASMYPRAIQPF